MSEKGWRKFLGAEGVDDWVVLHRVCIASWPDKATRQPETSS